MLHHLYPGHPPGPQAPPAPSQVRVTGTSNRLFGLVGAWSLRLSCVKQQGPTPPPTRLIRAPEAGPGHRAGSARAVGLRPGAGRRGEKNEQIPLFFPLLA